MQKYFLSAFWWLVTIITLFILDDLLFGPFFWALSLWSQAGSTLIAYLASFSFGSWLVLGALRDDPSKPARFFLKRLMLERPNHEIAVREDSIKRTATSFLGALLVTPLIGGVIPTTILAKKAVAPLPVLRRYGVCLTALYAVEFALLHGGYGIGAIVRWFI